jgi:hypothetical protein
MSLSFSRRRAIGVGGTAALAPMALLRSVGRAAPLPSTVTGPLVVLFEPIRSFDSRVEPPSIGGGKLAAGNSVAVTVPGETEDGTPIVAVFLNCTITQTEGAGYLIIRGSDLSGERPLPNTSNINWTSSGQTLGNMVLSTVGGESAIEVHAGGNGRTHFIIDVQGYVPLGA